MSNIVKNLLGTAPTPAGNNVYGPSPLALKLATSDVTDYKKVTYDALPQTYKILMLCSEQSDVPMTNGTFFFSGNHPVETLVPMLHLQSAGFEFDIVTPHGKPVKFEMWAMPKKDKNVQAIYDEYKSQFDHPKNLADLAKNNFASAEEYAAIYIPGGHGALLGLPNDENVGALIRWAFDKDLFHLSICHGPAAMLAAAPKNKDEPFIYDGYEITAFPDKVDRQTPLVGYMPGQLTWFFGEKLQELGVTIINTEADKSCHADRKLVTGASPKAANEFGKLAATTLVRHFNK
ncbi:protein deglycase HchA [Candidatus Mycosynbacter amalyticus]|uniref:Protein deglycase HchA n=1 Tax=Candidatus Mycosynbacter amalyticus TaxID=2665156 RepID=A0A857MIB1_9BACT|nr:glyoxalase III HchA [Candidatus Mycosynbacter amalyticus]QHN42304.1 protein deglycase HchA [Candidatus Mycosynbacter amalyticus]